MIAKLNGTRETIAHPDNQRMRLFINTEVENYPMHWHTDIEIIMALENIYTLVINEIEYVLDPGDIIMIPSGEIHELFAPQSGKRLIIQLDNFILNNVNGFDSIYNKFYPCTIIRKDYEDPYHKELVTLLEQITHDYIYRTPLCEASIYSKSIYFFVVIGRNYIVQDTYNVSNKRQKQHQYIDKFLDICKYINEHCTEEITVDELATLAGFSKYHFSRLFQEFSGISYYDYLTKRRIMFAETLLTDPNLTMVEIAMRSGFNSLPTFNRNFRTIKKCTPTEYRCMYTSISPQ